MKIVLATPLYPPDIAEPAPYVKELAKRLSSRHEVTIVTYGYLPEKVSGVKIITTDKRQPLLARLMKYSISLAREAKRADIIYAQNGPSVELPILFVSLFVRSPIILRLGDQLAHNQASKHFLLRLLEAFALNRARKVLKDIIPSRPELLPLEPKPEKIIKKYEESWQNHLQMLENIFAHV